MKASHDSSKGRRGAVDPRAQGESRITTRIDRDDLDWFRAAVQVEKRVARPSKELERPVRSASRR